MNNIFKYRSDEPELLDSLSGKELILKNLHELDLLNRCLGGHYISIQGIKKMISDRQRVYNIVDIGCGSGDLLIYIAKWAKNNNIKVNLTGVDINSEAIDYLNKKCHAFSEIQGVVSDYNVFLKNEKSIDIVHCSLFCHHLNNSEMLNLLLLSKNIINTGLVINDLCRNRFSYYAVRLITNIFNTSSFAKHDGPVSVLRGFKRNELEKLLTMAEIKNYTIKRKLGYRYLLLILNS